MRALKDLMKPLIHHGVKNMEVCVDQYTEAPEGVPVWCVEQSLGAEVILQLIGELCLLVVLFWGSTAFFRFLRRRKAQKQWEREQLNKSEKDITIWHP